MPLLAGRVSIKELAEYFGHADKAFTFRVYALSQRSGAQGARGQGAPVAGSGLGED
jgi:hypothetical protein